MGGEHGDDPAWDAAEAEALYTLLGHEIVPSFYTRAMGTGSRRRGSQRCARPCPASPHVARRIAWCANTRTRITCRPAAMYRARRGDRAALGTTRTSALGWTCRHIGFGGPFD